MLGVGCWVRALAVFHARVLCGVWATAGLGAFCVWEGIATGAAAAMDKGKRAKVEEEEGSELDAELVMAIEKLQEVQDELERVRANPRLPSFPPAFETLL